ncbi:MAG TPA: sugar phosphate isomerase/epimerase family protein [Armatimonadota bacterium]|nr:sugar phosphate isomerase/epimerase family protein [Armatimonadota bacterium]
MTEANPQPFNISLCTIAFRERLLEYSLDLAAEVGFQGVEIWGREPHISEEYDKNRVAAAARMVAERGLQVAVFGSYLKLGATNNDERVELKDVLRIAAGLGAPIVRVWASDVGSDEAEESLWSRTIDEAGEAASRAAKMGVTLAVEMHSNTLCDTGATTRRLLDAVNCPSFGANYQASSRQREETALERLEIVLPRVVHAHAQNYTPLEAGSDRVERVALSDGAIEYGPLLDLLRKSGYQGYISVEFAASNATDKREAIARDYHYLRGL